MATKKTDGDESVVQPAGDEGRDRRSGPSKGGAARAKALTATARSEIAREAAQARWKGVPKATHVGDLKLGELSIPCAVLDDPKQTRVLSQRGFYAAVGASTPGRRRGDGDGNMPTFLSAANLQPFISRELAATLAPVVYKQPPQEGMRGGGGGFVAHGIKAVLIPDICDVWLKARDAGQLRHRQQHIAAKAELLMRGLAKVGIIALVDEATGFQADRDRADLARILEAYIVEEMRPWIRMFPHEFFKQIHRLQGWDYKEGQTRGPRYVGKLINKYIYDRLPPGVHDELRKKNPAVKGRRKTQHHRWLTEDTGVSHLDKQITAVTTLMAVSDDNTMFESLLKKRFPKIGDQVDLPISKIPAPAVEDDDGDD